MIQNHDLVYQDIVVLLTATIDPRDVLDLQRSDLQERLSDYEKSLKFWIANKHTTKLIFCDNSGYDLSLLKVFCEKNNPHQKKIELFSFRDNNYPREFGKGYGEMRIIEYVIENSNLIVLNTLIIKVTGRLFIANIGTIINGIKSNPKANIYCNLNGYQTIAQSYMFCASVSFLKNYLFPRKEMINDSKEVFFEHILAQAVHASLAEGNSWSMLPGFLDIRGISATTGDIYTRSFISRLKGLLFYKVKLFVLFREG